jgi:CRISPR-associated protein Csm4
MPDLTLYHLDFGGTLHLGRRGIGQEATGVHLPADSLFAALVSTWVEAGETADSLVEAFPRLVGETASEASPPFLLTSAFPYAGQVRFYPAPPLAYLRIAAASREKRLKELKRISYISESLFDKLRAGQSLEAWLPAEGEAGDGDRGCYLQQRSLWLTAEEVAGLPRGLRQVKDRRTRRWRDRPRSALAQLKVWQTHKAPRVTVDRRRNASNIFHTGRLTFSPGCGLWFGLVRRTDAWPARLKQALDLMADGGLGGERAVGYGHFTWRTEEREPWPAPQDGQLFLTLSRYHPRAGEVRPVLADPQAAYELVSVGGWLNSPQTRAQRRRRLWMVAEGSVLRAAGAGPWGDVTDVQPVHAFPHPIWRYGLACPVAWEVSDEL